MNKSTREKKSSRQRLASEQLNRNGGEEMDYPEFPSGVGRIPDEDEEEEDEEEEIPDGEEGVNGWVEFCNTLIFIASCSRS